MPDPAYVREYFSRHAEFWNEGHYNRERWPVVYPIGTHRVRVALDHVVRRLGPPARRLIDLGCGGGDLCLHAARLGFTVTGIDIAEGMIAQARGRAEQAGAGNVTFMCGDVLRGELPAGSFDAITALGLIEYLPEDEPFFREAARLLAPGGTLVLSLRNRLFNLASANEYTRAEVRSGEAAALLDSLVRLPEGENVSDETLREFARRLTEVAGDLMAALAADEQAEAPPEDARPTAFAQPRRQHTPDGLVAVAAAAGFTEPAFTAVHPHPLPPDLERRAPRFFNRLASAFEVFEESSVGLRWSSTFMAAFTKTC